jgi:hypothetical protein
LPHGQVARMGIRDSESWRHGRDGCSSPR